MPRWSGHARGGPAIHPVAICSNTRLPDRQPPGQAFDQVIGEPPVTPTTSEVM
jgi:hypothetical protein